MEILKSKIKSKKPIPWGQVIVIKELNIQPAILSQMEKGVRENNPNISQEELQQQVYKMVLRDNYFNHVMDLISRSYEVELDANELKQRELEFKQHRNDLKDDLIKEIVRLNIIRELIFADMARQFSIVVTDEQTKESLDRFYQQTGQSIREFLANRKKFEEIKKTIFDQIISERLMNAFKPDFQLDEFNKRMEAEHQKRLQEQQKNENSSEAKKAS
ncbi:Trigger factor, C-terminal domain-containing protein [[Mycoplasma] cavipharyngis]|uniref:MPN555 family protein chaperone n=1 Tax=[Mycoplasma] cavipharyngis TaxID=92757 RepID=UPI003704166A